MVSLGPLIMFSYVLSYETLANNEENVEKKHLPLIQLESVTLKET
jgi:hypothetical protein